MKQQAENSLSRHPRRHTTSATTNRNAVYSKRSATERGNQADTEHRRADNERNKCTWWLEDEGK
jgi:hypothetical protein